MLPGTSERVPLHSSDQSNDRLRAQALERIAECARDPSQIEERLRELDHEWDIERALNGSVIAGAGLVLAARFSRWWLLLPGAVVTFYLQRALQGWYRPLPLFRRLGLRTQREIDDERTALKVLRGDYADLSIQAGDPARMAEALLARSRW